MRFLYLEILVERIVILYILIFILMTIIAYIGAFKDDFKPEDLSGASLVTITLVVFLLLSVIVAV